MDIGSIALIVLAVVLLFVVGVGPSIRRQLDATDKEARAAAPGVDVNRQFERPRNEGDLL
jgi:hypothetical protein